MAIELYSENLTSTNVSPRISFSHDFSQADVIPVDKYIESNSSSTGDFDFCVFRGSFDEESSLADDIFLDGKILPVEIKKKLAAPPKKVVEPPLSPPHPPPQYDHKINSTSNKNNIWSSEEKQNKSFWQFKRSSSLNCGGGSSNGRGYGRSLCPLILLSRSNSTGSATSSKRSSISKCSLNHKQQQKSSLINNSAAKPSQFLSSSSSHQKPPLKKNIQGSYGINLVLNVTTECLFGVGSIFSGGKDKNKSKKL